MDISQTITITTEHAFYLAGGVIGTVIVSIGVIYQFFYRELKDEFRTLKKEHVQLQNSYKDLSIKYETDHLFGLGRLFYSMDIEMDTGIIREIPPLTLNRVLTPAHVQLGDIQGKAIHEVQGFTLEGFESLYMMRELVKSEDVHVSRPVRLFNEDSRLFILHGANMVLPDSMSILKCLIIPMPVGVFKEVI